MTVDPLDSNMIRFQYLYFRKGEKDLEIWPAPMRDVALRGLVLKTGAKRSREGHLRQKSGTVIHPNSDLVPELQGPQGLFYFGSVCVERSRRVN